MSVLWETKKLNLVDLKVSDSDGHDRWRGGRGSILTSFDFFFSRIKKGEGPGKEKAVWDDTNGWNEGETVMTEKKGQGEFRSVLPTFSSWSSNTLQINGTHNSVRRKRNWSDSSGSSLDKGDVSRWVCKKIKRMKSSYRWSVVSTVNGTKTIGSGLFR